MGRFLIPQVHRNSSGRKPSSYHRVHQPDTPMTTTDKEVLTISKGSDLYDVDQDIAFSQSGWVVADRMSSIDHPVGQDTHWSSPQSRPGTDEDIYGRVKARSIWADPFGLLVGDFPSTNQMLWSLCFESTDSASCDSIANVWMEVKGSCHWEHLVTHQFTSKSLTSAHRSRVTA